MKDIILVAAVLGAFGFGYFLMIRLDRFLDENRTTIRSAAQKNVPSCVMLTEELSEEELVEEIRCFREAHKDAYILLCDGTERDVS